MDTPTTPSPSRRQLHSRADYDEAVAALFDSADKELAIFDPDGVQLGLNSPQRSAALQTLLRAGPLRRVTLVLQTCERIARDAPRLTALLRLYPEQLSIRVAVGDALRAQDCFVIADDAHCVRRPVVSQPRGVWITNDTVDTGLQRERFAQILVSSEVGLSASTLGL